MSSYDYEKEPQGAESFCGLKMDARTKHFLNVIKTFSCPKILEVGAGQGRFLKKIARMRSDVCLYGVDISKTAIAAIRRENVLKGEFVVGDAQSLPFADNFFDVVVIMDVLEHLENPQKAVSEAERVLRPGGVFHFYVPCERQLFTLNWFLRKTNFLNFRDFTKIHFGHIQYFSHQDIKKIMSPYFSKISIAYSEHLVSQFLHFLILYIPKKLLSFFSKDIQRKMRSGYEPSNNNEKVDALILILKNVWSFFIFPITIICETEARLLSRFSFMAAGIHFTGFKDNEPS